MVLLIRPILLTFFKSEAAKRLVVDVLKKLVSTTDNTIDDQAVKLIEKNLFPNPKVTSSYWLEEKLQVWPLKKNFKDYIS